MLWSIFCILLVCWLLGLVALPSVGYLIHVLLIAALIVLIIQLVTGRRPPL
jgi:hypothetical protein